MKNNTSRNETLYFLYICNDWKITKDRIIYSVKPFCKLKQQNIKFLAINQTIIIYHKII